MKFQKNSHEHSTHTHHPLREKAKVNSFLSYQETKHKALLLYWLLSLGHVTSSPSRDSRTVLAMEREWNVEIGRPSQNKNRTIKCGGGGIFGSFRTQWQNEKQNNFRPAANEIDKEAGPRRAYNNSSFTRQQLLDAFEPKKKKNPNALLSCYCWISTRAANLHFSYLVLVQNRKRACLWTRRTANLRNCMKQILFWLLFCLIYILWGFLFLSFLWPEPCRPCEI